MNTEKFTGKADVYAESRPSYAPEAIDYIFGISPRNAVFADIGAGTGIFTELLAKRGNEIYAVEPNGDMRGRLTALLSAYPNARVINGTAENTALADGSIDVAVCAQAFHWFDPESYRRECGRILRPGGKIIIVNNTDLYRNNAELDWRREFSAHDNTRLLREEKRKAFFNGYVLTAEFPNPIRYDREGFMAFMLSHSTAPSGDDPDYTRFVDSVNAIFDRESADGFLTKQFVTTVYASSRYASGAAPVEVRDTAYWRGRHTAPR
jgi:SAM-dependent methyltransferase